ncbi:hypothetical protein K438DRAFT_1840994 [Mycena galopus ATCC 62051]|nr:hypothetical protein K438DRAFT_1840994 [Mycena galopus ATCC 62051]
MGRRNSWMEGGGDSRYADCVLCFAGRARGIGSGTPTAHAPDAGASLSRLSILYQCAVVQLCTRFWPWLQQLSYRTLNLSYIMSM